MKYRDNMTPAELADFMSEVDALNAAYAGAAEHDAKTQEDAPEEWDDPSNYAGMGWVDSRGRS